MITCHSVFNVWPKTPLLPVWPRDAKRLDTPFDLDPFLGNPLLTSLTGLCVTPGTPKVGFLVKSGLLCVQAWHLVSCFEDRSFLHFNPVSQCCASFAPETYLKTRFSLGWQEKGW